MTTDASFDALLEHLKRTRGFDFRAYKQVGLERRVKKRLQAIGIREYAEYLDFIEVHPEEFGALFNTIHPEMQVLVWNHRAEDLWGLRADDELMAAHEVLGAERQRYLSLFELAPDGYLVTDDQGMVREANRAALAMLQADVSAVVGKPL